MLGIYCLNGKRRSSWFFYSDLKSVGNAVFAALLNNRYQYILTRSLKGGVHDRRYMPLGSSSVFRWPSCTCSGMRCVTLTLQNCHRKLSSHHDFTQHRTWLSMHERLICKINGNEARCGIRHCQASGYQIYIQNSYHLLLYYFYYIHSSRLSW